jgi:hypothetical protein
MARNNLACELTRVRRHADGGLRGLVPSVRRLARCGQSRGYTAYVKRSVAPFWPFITLHVALVLGRDWHALAVIDGAVAGFLALGLMATRIWPDRIWIRDRR